MTFYVPHSSSLKTIKRVLNTVCCDCINRISARQNKWEMPTCECDIARFPLEGVFKARVSVQRQGGNVHINLKMSSKIYAV